MALVATVLAALIILLDLFSAAFRVACLGVIAATTVLAAPERRANGISWWLLLGGAIASVLGAIIAQSSTTLGGWIALIGGLVVIVGALIGFPAGEE